MEQESEDDLWKDGYYESDPQPPPSKEEQLEEDANRIYEQLIGDDELMHKVNVLLRKHKLEQLKNK